MIRWVPPWPLIQISTVEWLVIRDDPSRPTALIRYPSRGPAGGACGRFGRWAPASADRKLFEYFSSLERCDMAVIFLEVEPVPVSFALSNNRSGGWARFERWVWDQATELMVHEFGPGWVRR